MGFGLAFTASFLSGARWTFSQKVLQKSKLNLQNPIDFIYHIQPFMVLTILPLAVYVEGNKIISRPSTVNIRNLDRPDFKWSFFGHF
jgi:solute carrier family 35 protein C2